MTGVSLNILYEALGSQFGVVLQCDNAEKVRQRLYKLVKESNDPDLEILSFVQSPTNPSQLWIVNRLKVIGAKP